jgi:hypothetical protein
MLEADHTIASDLEALPSHNWSVLRGDAPCSDLGIRDTVERVVMAAKHVRKNIG